MSAAGQPVTFLSTGALPTGITTGTVYFISAAGQNPAQFQIADTKAHALAGTNSINTSGSQSGSQSMLFPRAYAVGDTVLRNVVTATTSPGWVCTTAGLSMGTGAAVFTAMPVL